MPIEFGSLFNPYLAALAEWLSGSRNAKVNWTSPGQSDNMVYHQVQLEDPAPFQEYSSQASDGIAYYAMSTVREELPCPHLQLTGTTIPLEEPRP